VAEDAGDEVGEDGGDKVGEDAGDEAWEGVGEWLGVAFPVACPFACCGAPQAVRKMLIRDKVRTRSTIPGAL